MPDAHRRHREPHGPALGPAAATSTATPTPSASAAGIDTGSPVHEMANVKTGATPTAERDAKPHARADDGARDDAHRPLVPVVDHSRGAGGRTTRSTARPLRAAAAADLGDPNAAFVTCDAVDPVKYILGPVEMDGKDVSTAASGPHMTQARHDRRHLRGAPHLDGQWRRPSSPPPPPGCTNLNEAGAAPRDQFAMVLDGVVISAPRRRQWRDHRWQRANLGHLHPDVRPGRLRTSSSSVRSP